MTRRPDKAALEKEVRQLRAKLDRLRADHEGLLRALEERDGSLMDDLLQAQRFQRSIMPPPPALPGTEIEVLYQPLDVVGGDLYDITAIDDERVRIFIADATGHGVTASLTTMFIKSEYEIIKRTVKGPVGVLRVLNERIARTYRHLDMRFTALCLNIDLKNRTLSYASAAHPPPCLVRGGEVTELESGGPFMGLTPDVPFPERKLPIEPGDGVYAFTDGLTEAWSARGEAFGERRVYAAIADAVARRLSARAAVTAHLDEFLGPGRRRSDDVTFVGLRWVPETEPTAGTAGGVDSRHEMGTL